MSRIQILPPHEAHKIAAGEVVERPANVIKELIENSIDAGATHITLIIEDGGKKLIRCIDNGSGMSAQDAQLCFTHHATSKIRCVDDLATIATFGFRGEALTSIAAVSDVTLITKEQEALHGIEIMLTQGTLHSELPASGNPGTDISISNLFYNVPARKKFLKKKETELTAIQQLFNAFCLDYRTIHFKLVHEERTLINCPPAESLQERIAQIWDGAFNRHILPLKAQHESYAVSIEGVISGQHYFRYDRSNIFLFVNNRWIKNQALSKAIIKGYNNVLPPARFPAACIFITVPCEQVDINIHPRKEEVQFLHPYIVEQLIQKTVSDLLAQQTQERIQAPQYTESPLMQTTPHASYTPPFSTLYEPKTSAITFGKHTAPAIQPSIIEDQQLYAHATNNTIATNALSSYSAHQEHAPLPLATAVGTTQQGQLHSVQEWTSTIIGQWHKTYILIEHSEGLLLVDQHAAHERVLYELFSERFAEVATVQLLFPHIITLSVQDINSLEPYLGLFKENGITLDLFSETQLMVIATPVHLKDQSIEDLVKEIIGWIAEQQQTNASNIFQTMHHKLRAQMACKAAVKAGDTLTQDTMQQLLIDLHATTNRFTCPHGRPTTWLLHTADVEKKFKRKL